MKLQSRFIQLPLQFDAKRLAAEIGQVDESAWLPHPQGFAGNDFLPLVSVRGDPKDDSFTGAMRPTPYLEKCSYLVDVLASLGASIGRTRLMRLSGHAEVTPHVDAHYYWRDRMRVHVPIVTQPTVRFICADQEVNMKEGECWIFDTWARHRVINDAVESRIHLVADTVGGEGFWNLAAGGRAPNHPSPQGWAARQVEPFGASVHQLDLESTNVPVVMTPWEVREHINFLLTELQPNQPAFAATAQATSRFVHIWRALWSTFGESREGWPRYRRALEDLLAGLRAARADTLKLKNGGALMASLNALVIGMALSDKPQDDGLGERRDDVGEKPSAPMARPAAAVAAGHDPLFDRPIFIVNPPRSGSTLLFETLAQAPGLYTIGGESHGLIEGIPALGIAAKNFASNRLDGSDATPATVAELRNRFAVSLRDRAGARPKPGERVRMLEKTPKNALRIPFLAAAFPEARFIYLYRDPRQVLSSMMEAWMSGRFRTYPGLPGWEGELPWSMLLTPGWRDLARLPLNERVASQWAAATRILLDDLEAVPRDRWTIARYDALTANPSAEVSLICEAMDLAWDKPLGDTLPIAMHTVSKPRDDKWQARQAEIEGALKGVAQIAERAEKTAAR